MVVLTRPLEAPSPQSQPLAEAAEKLEQIKRQRRYDDAQEDGEEGERNKKRKQKHQIVRELIRDDVEFAEDDYDGRIKRCEERIKEGYPRKLYEGKIERLKAQKEIRPSVLSQYPGKSWDVIERIEDLKMIAAHLVEVEDPCVELPNVKAIIAAYEHGELEWNDNATYWAQGKMVGGPSLFSWDDFARFNTKENRGEGGFWVEGIFPLHGPALMAVTKYKTQSTSDHGEVKMELVLRLAQSVANDAVNSATHDYTGQPFPEVELEFNDDTGAGMMFIFNDDLETLMGRDVEWAGAPPQHVMGYTRSRTADGSTMFTKLIAVDVNIMGKDENGNPSPLGDWDCIPCCVFDGNKAPRQARLNGPWLRRRFYVASAPEYPSATLYVGQGKSDLWAKDMLPKIGPNRAAPKFYRPQKGVTWELEPISGIHMPTPDRTRQGNIPPEQPGSTPQVSPRPGQS